jgi:hemerythrin superfamily protein
MSGIDKILSAVTPLESEEKRREAREKAREKARAQARPADWLSTIIDHHEAIERAAAAVRSASDASARRAAEKTLATLLTGHGIAEEAAVYPALVQIDEPSQASTAYMEQAAVKVLLATLETLDPMSQDYLDALGRFERVATQHSYEEERQRFPELLSRASPEMNQRIVARYREEFERYVGEKALLAGAMYGAATGEPRTFAADQRPSASSH